MVAVLGLGDLYERRRDWTEAQEPDPSCEDCHGEGGHHEWIVVAGRRVPVWCRCDCVQR